MRSTIVALCVLTAACSGDSLNSPSSPSAVAGAPVLSEAPEIPFRGSFTRRSQAEVQSPTLLVITATLTGTATHLGRFKASSEDRVDSANNTAAGTLNFTAANGDQLFTETEGVENEFTPPNVSKVIIEARIVGGTGRFTGATGTFTIHLTDIIDFASSTGTGSGTFEGHINFR